MFKEIIKSAMGEMNAVINKEMLNKEVIEFLRLYILCEVIAKQIIISKVEYENSQTIMRGIKKFKGKVIDDKILKQIANGIETLNFKNINEEKLTVDVSC